MGDELVAPAVPEQDRAGDLVDLDEAVEAVSQEQRGGQKGKLRRDISAMLVNVLKAISPATGLREARSMATAPPSDQPAAMILLGSISLRVWRWAQGSVGRGAGSRPRSPCPPHMP